MIDDNGLLLALLNGKSKVTALPGTFVSASSTGFVVDVGGGRIPATPATSYLPEVNEPVSVWFIDGVPFVMGPTVAKPGQGTVVSVAAGLVTLSTAFGNVVVPYASTLSPTAGQVMKLQWQGGGFAAAVMSTSPVGGVAPPAPSGGATTHVDLFTSLDAGSYGSGRWWTPQVYASDSNLGAWFYGSKIGDTIPASAAIQLVEVYVPSGTQIGGAAPNFALHAYASNPGSSPSFTSATAEAITPGAWVALPTSFGNALKAGGGSLGIGVNHGGYNIFPSRAQDGQTGALRITSIY
jgi:hypothetical protein